jgi:signal transduction histidine kinase
MNIPSSHHPWAALERRLGDSPGMRLLVIACGAAVIALAFASDRPIHGWAMIVPEVFCGLALILVGVGRVAIPTALAFVAATWALLVTGDVVLSVGARAGPALPSVRASVLIPVGLTLCGFGLLLYPLFAAGTALCGGCGLAIGVLCVLLPHDVFRLAQTIGIRPENVTPFPAALLPLVLGAGVTIAPRVRPFAARRLGYAWAPGAATFLLVMMSLVLWQALVRLQMRELARLTGSAATNVSAKLLSEVNAIGSIVHLLSRQPPDPARAWAQEADVLRRTSPAVVALSFRDAHLGLVQQVALSPEIASPPELLPQDRELLKRTRKGEHLPVVTHVNRAREGHPIVRIALARDRVGKATGYVMAAVDVGTLLDDQVVTVLQDYAVRLEVAGMTVFERGDAGVSWDDPVVQARVVDLPGGTQWTLRVNPSPQLRRSARSALPDIVLGASLLLALLLGSTLRLARSTASQAIVLSLEAEQRRRAEAEIRAMARDLEGRVRERTGELEQANRSLALENAMRQRADTSLRRSNEDLRQFAAFVSHELRQPLSTIGIWAELLEGGPPPLTEKQHRHLEKIRAAVARMARLIESELALAQLSHGELPMEPVDLATLLAEIRSDMAPQLAEAGARLETGTLSTVTADPQQLRLLFRNLIENALKYRRDEPPVVRIEERDPDDPAVCTILVRDNGRGFTAETAERMFTIFDRTTDGTIPGTGIGLAICRRIVERHGGRIQAIGDPNVGATFTIELARQGTDPDLAAVSA